MLDVTFYTVSSLMFAVKHHTNAITQPKNVQPKNSVKTKIATVLL